MGRHDEGPDRVILLDRSFRMSVPGEGGALRRPQLPRDLSRRAGGLCAVILVHIALGIGLLAALDSKVDIVSSQPLLAKLIEPEKPREQLPLMPALKMLAPPPPFIPIPEIKTFQPPPPNAIAVFSNIVAAASQSAGAEAGSKAAGDKRVAATGEATGHVAPRMVSEESCIPLYPPASRRLGQRGTTKVLLLIDVDGKVVSGKISQSSGYAWLDDAALAALASCAFLPGSYNGKPERVWHIVPYTFSLEH